MAAATHYQRKLYPISNREVGFSHWSRHEPPRAQRTDHWSKLRSKSYQLAQLPTGNYISFCKPHEHHVQNYSRFELPAQKPSGTLARTSSPDFNRHLSSLLYTSPLNQPGNTNKCPARLRVPSASSQRAKRGFKYWNRESKPAKPAHKITVGSKGTFLGIGVPRL